MTQHTYLSQLKILYVEDDDNTREDLRHYLKKKAGKVITAADGAEGLRKFEEEQPDIVIADLLLPKMNGIDMLRLIRKSGGKAPFIITSSVDNPQTIIEAVDTGITKYVLKPIILDKLLDTLNKTAEELASEKVVFDNFENRLELEKQIKQAFTAYLKKTVGKGPRDLSAFISGNKVEISAYGMITPIEKKILENRYNISLIERLHQAFYQNAKPELESLLSEIIGFDSELTENNFIIRNAVDKLIFTLIKKVF